jgi:hypothetical protein
VHVLRVLLGEFAWGKPECWPSDGRIADLTGLSTRTVSRCLNQLAKKGLIRIVNPKSWRRKIEFPTHPGLSENPAIVSEDAAAVSGAPRHNVRGSVVVEAVSEPTPPTPLAPNELTKGFAEAWAAIRAQHVPPPSPPARDQLVLRGGSATSAPMPAAERSAIIAEALGGPTAAGDGPPRDPGPKVGQDGPPAPGSRGGAINAAFEAETIAALSRLGCGATRGEVERATVRLTLLLRDHKSRGFYRKVCNETARGELPARVVVAAVGSALGPGVIRPGAAFTAHVLRCKTTMESRR